MSDIREFIPREAQKGTYGEGKQNEIFIIAYPANGKRKSQIVSYVPAAVGDFLGEVDSLAAPRQRSKLIRHAVKKALIAMGLEPTEPFNEQAAALSEVLGCGISYAIIAATRWWIANRRTDGPAT